MVLEVVFTPFMDALITLEVTLTPLKEALKEVLKVLETAPHHVLLMEVSSELMGTGSGLSRRPQWGEGPMMQDHGCLTIPWAPGRPSGQPRQALRRACSSTANVSRLNMHKKSETSPTVGRAGLPGGRLSEATYSGALRSRDTCSNGPRTSRRRPLRPLLSQR